MARHSTVEAAAGNELSPETADGKRRSMPWRGLVVVVCLALYPFATFVATNRDEGVRLGDIVPYAAIIVAVGLVVVGAVWRFAGSVRADRVAVALGGGWFVTVNYAGISSTVDGLGGGVWYRITVWGLLCIAVVTAAWWASRRPAVRLWFLVVAIVLTGLPAIEVAQHRIAVSEPRRATGQAVVAGLERTPDIYYVIPDAYGRADVLEDMFGFDNSAFLDSLRDRGFVIADDAYANYPRTFLSVPAVLEMDYVVDAAPEALNVAGGGRVDRSSFYGIIQGDSVIARTLRQASYRHVQAPPGTWRGSDCSGVEDLCVEPISESGAGVVLGEVEWALLQMTPAADLLSGLGETFDEVDADPVHTVREIEQQGWEEPVFAFVHMMRPHPPFTVDERCRPAETAARDLMTWPEGSEPDYIAAIQCTNRRLEAMIDVLPRDAVVVIQADHGSSYRGRGTDSEAERWSEAHIRERFGILSAVRLPEDCRDMVDDRFGGVNTFRVVLACLSGQTPDLLPDRLLYNVTRNAPDVLEAERPR